MAMRRLLILFAALSASVALAPTHAQSKSEMPVNIAQFWKRLGKAKTITFTMKDWAYDRIGWMSDPRPGSQIFYVEHTYEVKAQRPNRLSISVSTGIEREVVVGDRRQRQFINSGGDIYINNGKQSITLRILEHTYRMGKGMDTLTKDWSEHAVHVQTPWLFSQKPMEGYRVVPESLAQSSNPIVFTWADPKSPNSQQRIYFDRKTGNLMQTSDFDKDDKGIWRESRRQELRFWDFNARLSSDAFSVLPPRTYVSQ
jgi:outer membrane lipoprotein-sorting protein